MKFLPKFFRYSFLLISFFASGLYGAEPLKTIENCTLVPTEWADGDSFLIKLPDGSEHTARLYGADCIEWHVSDESDERRLRSQRRYFGIAAAAPTAREAIDLAKGFGKAAADEVRICLEKPFKVHTAFADARGDGRYTRIYVFVTLSNGDDLASHLVKKGLARAFGVYRETDDGKSSQEYRAHLQDLEMLAAKKGLGIWAKTDWDKMPLERQQQRMEDEEVAIALAKPGLTHGESIDPNSAARDELMKIPGIGEGLANRIIAGRPYQKPEDLLDVSGIGPSTLGKIREYLKFASSE